jgi:hypothetical protein
MAELKIDTKIIDKIGGKPGTTPHRIATTLILAAKLVIAMLERNINGDSSLEPAL